MPHCDTRRRTHMRVTFRTIALSLLLGGSTLTSTSTPAATPTQAMSTTAPLLVVQNVGQWTRAARYQIQSGLGTIWLTDTGLWLTVVGGKGEKAKGRKGSRSPRSPFSPFA